jgi:hypothetical protein
MYTLFEGTNSFITPKLLLEFYNLGAFFKRQQSYFRHRKLPVVRGCRPDIFDNPLSSSTLCMFGLFSLVCKFSV